MYKPFNYAYFDLFLFLTYFYLVLKKNIVKRKYLIIIISLLVIACSTKKNTALSRFYQGMTTKFNVLYNAKLSYKKGMERMKDSHTNNYAEILDFYLSDDEKARAAAFSDMDRCSAKAMKAIKLHSITVKPKRKNKKTKKYKEFRKKKEYNIFIDDCYLIKIKADFYNKKYGEVERASQFVFKNFKDPEILLNTRLYYTRSLVEQKRFTLIAEQLAEIEKLNSKTKSFNNVNLLISYYNFYIGEYERSIFFMKNYISSIKKNKPYYTYLLAQLYILNKNNNQALNTFNKIDKMKCAYEMKFNAKISKAEASSGNVSENLLNEYKNLLKSRKNRKFKDQIYFTMGDIHLKNNNKRVAMEYFKKSLKYSTSDDTRRAWTFKKIGDLLYDRMEYIDSYKFYDSCFFYNSKAKIKFKEESKRYNYLKKFVNSIYNVQKQDSLVYLSKLTDKERDKIINKKIQEYNDKIAFQEAQENQESINQSFYSNISVKKNLIGEDEQIKGKWYFYNFNMITSGKSEFSRIWGRRKLEDNWNRINKAIIDENNDDADTDPLDIDDDKKDKKLKPNTKEYYLKNIPLSEEARAKVDSSILASLSIIGDIAFNNLRNYDIALKSYENIIDRFPNNKKIDFTYYNAYKSAKALNEYEKMDFYKNELIKKYPKSKYVEILNDLNYQQNYAKKVKNLNSKYELAFNYFDRGLVNKTKEICDFLLIDNPSSELKLKVKILQFLCVFNKLKKTDANSKIEELLKLKLDANQRKLLLNIQNSLVAKNTSSNAKTNINNEIILDYKLNVSVKHFVVISMPRTAKSLNQFTYRLNLICSEAVDDAILQVQKRKLGLYNQLFVVSPFKNKDESLKFISYLLRDKYMSQSLKEFNYKVFTISDANLNVLYKSEDLEDYISFYKKNYFKSEYDAKRMMGRVDRIDLLYQFHKKANHRCVILFQTSKVRKNVAKLVSNYDSDYEVNKKRYNADLNAVIIDNIGSYSEAISFVEGLKSYLKSITDFNMSRLNILLVADNNYSNMFQEKHLKEYQIFYKRYYSNVEKEDYNDENNFSYKPNSDHFFVLFYHNKINEEKLKKAFKSYNHRNLPVEIKKINKDYSALIVSNLSNKKKAMIYYRAVLTNKKLFRAVKGKKYVTFVVSENNKNLLKGPEIVDKYILVFNKWYLK
jgi:hypothetical protein